MPSLPFNKAGEFELVELLQDGPYSMAIRGFQPALNRFVFIKLLKPHVKNHDVWVARFQREAQVCARLRHPQIVDVYTIGEQDEHLYMALEYVHGISLKEYLRHEKTCSPEIALVILQQITQGLNFIHEQGIVHRDIKPGNIMIDDKGHVKIADFGLAYMTQMATSTLQGQILGTPAYMAPEQITGDPLTAATDYFALGATAYEMVTGIQPFAGDSYSACIQKILHEIPPVPGDVHPGLAALISQWLNKDPRERTAGTDASLRDLQAELVVNSEQVQKTLGAEISPLMPGRPGFGGEREHKKQWDVKKKRPAGKMIRVVAIISVVILLVILFWQPDSKERVETPLLSTAAISDSSTRPVRRDSMQVISPVPVAQKTTEKSAAPAEQNELKKSPVDAPLIAATATLRIHLEPWGRLMVNESVLDSMCREKEVTLPPGDYTLTLSHPQFSDQRIPVHLISGETKEINFSFLDTAGYLDVQVRPWAEVYIDGKYMDNTPLTRRISLSSGQHVLELKHPQIGAYRQVIEVVPHDTLFFKHVMN